MSEFENQFSLSLAPNGTSVVAKLGGVYTVSSPRCESKVPADFSLGPSAPCSELGGAGLRRSLNNGISSEKHPSRSRQHPPFVFVKGTDPAGGTLVHTDPGDPHFLGIWYQQRRAKQRAEVERVETIVSSRTQTAAYEAQALSAWEVESDRTRTLAILEGLVSERLPTERSLGR